MRKAVVIVTILALVTMVFAALPMNVSAATVEKITPKQGKVNNMAVVHGSGFRGASVAVLFGSRPASDVKIPGNSDKQIACSIPSRDPLEPSMTVKVTVLVDGVPANGDLSFTYDPPGPEPTITDFNPKSVMAGTEFDMEITGTNFMTPHGRFPDQAALVGPDILWASIISYNDTYILVRGPPAFVPSPSYMILVCFPCGSAANAEGFEIK